MKPEDLIPIVIASVAAGVSMVSVIISFLARLDSKRSADASVKSSEAAARSAKAAEGTLGIESDRRAEELSASRQAAEDFGSARLDAALTSAKELAIVNTGKCRAQNVALKLENDESDASTLLMVLFDGTREIGPGLSEVWRLLPHGGTAISYTVLITWTDQNGDHEVRQRVHA